ncbi:cell division protein FtsQ [Thiomicrospira aerophila AL3]|uniref:Cell division protein FtsQ n=1 Tax=Thiomicrospira aerophila AL3 TaxID=717772 RepID=W0DTE5_9GAMM|nr:FtsQ-type POTRA domain-containing protein [Thiomicrospira aerophila]AHF00558.1 cell division protein FtsQ [Thiomicrospira aerophila AL3]
MLHRWLKLGLVVLLAGLVVVWVLLMMKPEQNATLSYKIISPLQNITLDQVEDQIWPYLEQSFWDVDLVGLQQVLQLNPWVESAFVSKQWPNQLVLKLVEREPVARWRQQSLVDRQGVIFNPDDVAAFGHLVVLDAHELQSRAMLRHWSEVQALLNPLDWQVLGMTWFADDVLKVDVDAGHQIYLIASDKKQLVQRFMLAWPKLSDSTVQPVILNSALKQSARWKIDLRYSNGMALNPLNNVD